MSDNNPLGASADQPYPPAPPYRTGYPGAPTAYSPPPAPAAYAPLSAAQTPVHPTAMPGYGAPYQGQQRAASPHGYPVAPVNPAQAPGYAASLGYPTPMYPVAPPRPTNGLALTAMIAGIGSIVLGAIGIGVLGGILAIVTGHMGLSRIRQNPALGGRGMAIAGLVMGYVVVGFAVLFLIWVFIAVGMAMAA